MKIERYISVFERKTSKLIEEFNVSYLEVKELHKIFKQYESDYNFYLVYRITPKIAAVISSYLKEEMNFDFKKYFYQLDCYEVKS